MDSIALPINTDLTVTVSLKTASQVVQNGFNETDTLYADVWPGGELPVLWSPATAWVDSEQGTYKIIFSADDTADRDPGRYCLRHGVLGNDGTRHPAPDAEIVLLGSPGTDAAPLTDVSYGDLLRYAPWLDRKPFGGGLAGYLAERAAARAYIVRILSSWYSEWIARGRSYEGSHYGQPELTTLTGYLLDGSSLVVDDRLREIQSRYAIALILEHEITPMSKDNQYQELAEQNRQQVNNLMFGLEVRVKNTPNNIDVILDDTTVRTYAR